MQRRFLGRIGTADDQLEFTDYDYVNNRRIVYNDGGDGILSGDDTFSLYESAILDGSGMLSAVIDRNFGANATPFDADDEDSLCKEFVQIEGGFREIVKNPGADLTCFTGDDTISNYTNRTYRANINTPLTEVSYNGTGIDGTWFTSDDTLSQTNTFEYNDLNFSRLILTDPAGQLVGYGKYIVVDSIPAR